MTIDPPAAAIPASTGVLRGRRDVASITVFIAVAFGGSWLLALPLWLGDGLASSSFVPISIAIMMTPAIAALVVVFFVERSSQQAEVLGLLPVRPLRRLLPHAALGVVVAIALVLSALPVGALLGVFPADFLHLSGYRRVLHDQLLHAGVGRGAGGALPVPVGAIVALQLLTLPLAAFVNLIPALGEELGWRGWLWPKLLPLGTLPTVLVAGVIWGLWHAPLILLGYNYPDAPGWLGLTMMTGMCVLVGAVFGWLRLRSGSVWPAALAHGAFNAAGGTYLFFVRAGARVDTTRATILGWSGWIIPLILVAILLATRRFTSATRWNDTPVHHPCRLRRAR